MRVLAVDPGERYLGLALSDPSGTVAYPLATLVHQARAADAEQIVTTADEHDARLIVIGYPLNAEGLPGPQARHAENLAAAVRARTVLPVVLHDESYSSLTAAEAMRAAGKKRRARREAIHAAAAAAILQSYLDAHPGETPAG